MWPLYGCRLHLSCLLAARQPGAGRHALCSHQLLCTSLHSSWRPCTAGAPAVRAAAGPHNGSEHRSHHQRAAGHRQPHLPGVPLSGSKAGAGWGWHLEAADALVRYKVGWVSASGCCITLRMLMAPCTTFLPPCCAACGTLRGGCAPAVQGRPAACGEALQLERLFAVLELWS